MPPLQQQIIAHAKSLGFDLVGYSPVKLETPHLKAYEKWLKGGLHGNMKYMEKNSPRKNLGRILPGAKTVISLAINYYHEQKDPRVLETSSGSNYGIVARYAYGRDYHKIIGKKLKALEKFIQQCEALLRTPSDPRFLAAPLGSILTKSYVDTGPILERAFAGKSGLGQIGKNSCLITKEFGSWIFLCEIITNLDLVDATGSSARAEVSPEGLRSTLRVKSQAFSICGSCTRCIDACPTKAIIALGVIDSKKCLAYQTIENKGKIPEKIKQAIKKTKRIFGCDICQEVCPHNCRAKKTTHKEFLEPCVAGDHLDIKKILSIKTDSEFLKTFAGSPLMRAKRKGLQRNAKILT